MTIRAYLRVSTDDQRNGLEAQRHEIEAWAGAQGLEVGSWHVDEGVSGGAPLDRRPALLEAIELLGAGDVLVVHRRDRLARDALVAAVVEREVERAGARVASVDGAGNGDTPEAQLIRRILDAVSEYERAVIRLRIMRGMAAKKRRGERVGDVPYGRRLERGRLVEDERELAAAERVRALRASGLSLRAIARALEAEGYKPRGKSWHPTTIARLVTA